ncbi:MAG: LysR substrate-binding domain-containing protein [Pseudomonadota bacterium]
MLQNNITSIDLNLLKVLNEIEKRGSVTLAAEALGLGQPAVSQALARLRVTLNDDLFVRGPGGMVPTPRMAELTGPLRTALGQIEHSLFGHQSFDEAQTDTRFFIGASDYAASLFVPKIMKAMAERMPKAALSILRADKSDAERLLLNGEIDAALGLFTEKSEWIRYRHLYRERHVCVFNPDLLNLPDPLLIKDYAAYDHLLVSLNGSPSGFIDELLEKEGLTRRVALTTPYFLQCADLLEYLPLIATLPERFVRHSSSLSKMSVRHLPFDNAGFDVSVAWRKGDEKNPRSAALQDVVLKAVKEHQV